MKIDISKKRLTACCSMINDRKLIDEKSSGVNFFILKYNYDFII